ncbi:MAG: hypothetical protein ABF289_02630 [Clostridiales bacterium]
MINETKMYKILSFVHLIFITSIFLVIITIVSCGILFLPALTSVFYLGKELMFGNYNVFDGIFKILFKKLKYYIYMLRFLPVGVLFVLQCLGIYIAALQGMYILQVFLLSTGAFLLVYHFYICGYEVFIGKEYTWFQVILTMFYKISYFLTLWILAILAIVFFQLSSIKYLLITSGIIVLAIEIVIFLALISFKKVSGLLKDDDENELPEWYKKINNIN